MTTQLRHVLADFLSDDRANDIVEYAMLAAFFGIVGYAAWTLLEDTMFTTYTSWDTAGQDLWEPPPPASEVP